MILLYIDCDWDLYTWLVISVYSDCDWDLYTLFCLGVGLLCTLLFVYLVLFCLGRLLFVYFFVLCTWLFVYLVWVYCVPCYLYIQVVISVYSDCDWDLYISLFGLCIFRLCTLLFVYFFVWFGR